jgi:hypothetical protein
MSITDLCDADARTRDPRVREMASVYLIPHPLNNVEYADGSSRCRHAKKHGRFQACQQELRASGTKSAA